MLRKLLLAAVATACLVPMAAAAAQRQRPLPTRPNVLVIVADDMGFSDLGAFGGEINTPNLDRLANNGLKLTDLHAAPACSPTRAMLLTGLDSHEAGLGNMAELTAANQRGQPGYEGYLRRDVATLAERMSEAGYRTLYAGKWHLGVEDDQQPSARGFQHSYALLQGGSNYFGRDLSVDPHRGATYREDGRTVTELPADFYSTDVFAAKMAAQIRSTRSDKPFFAYLAFTAPHFPLQAPKADIAKYKGRYDRGWEALRDDRLRRLKALGVIPKDVVAHPFTLAPRWDSLSPEEKRLASRRMEVYAAMVDRLDQGVGAVLKALRETGELRNTLILFLSDNGAEGLNLRASRTGGPRAMIAASDNSLENLGAANSYDSLGPGWAEAQTAPAWLVKTFPTEGGTRVVAFLAGPGVRKGVDAAYLNVMDVVPTVLDVAGVEAKTTGADGRPLRPIRGLSWAPWLKGQARTVYPADKPVGVELFGGRAIRQGDWKITDPGDGKWRLYDIVRDPGETRDLSDQHPDRKASLLKAWDAYAAEVGLVMPDKITIKPYAAAQ